MRHCEYCASTVTRLDHFGYCVKYDCLSRSGKRDKLNNLIKRASDIYTMPDTTGQVSGPVSNFYSHRTRKANNIIYDAQREFGFVPMEVYERIPMKNRGRWDKNIRW